MNSQLELAKERLFGVGGFAAADIKLFPGSSREVSPAQMSQQLARALVQLEDGDYDVVDDSED